MKFTSAAIAALGLASSVSAVAVKKRAATDPIVIKGSKFFHKNSGEQFFMKGVAYQTDLSLVDVSELPAGQKFVDPLTDIEGCTRDVPLLEALNTNLIRVYAIDTEKSQDACMKLLSDAGIYVIADLSEPGLSVNRDAPAWDHHLYERYTAVIDKLQKYDNVMGFFAGNEVTNNKSNTDASPFVKASVRDMKAYIKEKGYRQIPVGYATNDDEYVRNQLADYFNCGDAEDSVDFWGYNIYSWCGQSSLKISGWDKRTEEYSDYNVPVFFAEYGCNEPSPRKFTEVEALYGPESWALEGFDVAQRTVYTLGSQPGCAPDRSPVSLPPGYVEAARQAASLQLEKAGVRLAAVLNRALSQAGRASRPGTAPRLSR